MGTSADIKFGEKVLIIIHLQIKLSILNYFYFTI